MSATGKGGEFQRAGQPRPGSSRSGIRTRGKARFFILIADDELAIARIKEIAPACIEIESLADELAPDGLSFLAARVGSTLLEHLTQRQFEIALGVARGLTNKDIGRELGISHFTVRNHLSQILLILGLSTRQDLREFLHTHLLHLP